MANIIIPIVRRPIGQVLTAFSYGEETGAKYRRKVEIVEYLYGEGQAERYRVRNFFTGKITVEVERDLSYER